MCGASGGGAEMTRGDMLSGGTTDRVGTAAGGSPRGPLLSIGISADSACVGGGRESRNGCDRSGCRPDAGGLAAVAATRGAAGGGGVAGAAAGGATGAAAGFAGTARPGWAQAGQNTSEASISEPQWTQTSMADLQANGRPHTGQESVPSARIIRGTA
jgi:hypothetical protein